MKHEINGKTGTLGIIGGNIEKSFSPFLHNKLLLHHSMNERYLPFQISLDQLPLMIEWMKVLKVKEMNVTAPFKEKIISFIDIVEEAAFRVGAMNTIVNKNGTLYGYNTDLVGFKRSLLDENSDNFGIKGKNAVVLGAGGAARAIIYILCQEGINKITIFNRTIKRAKKIKKEYLSLFPHSIIDVFPINDASLQSEIDRTDLLINATSLGAYPRLCQNPLPENILLNQHLFAYDLIYAPKKTAFLKQAEKAGARILNGEKMLVYQAVESFRLWSGIPTEKRFVKQLVQQLEDKNNSGEAEWRS